MSFREGDCEYCHAPAPALGFIEHERTCHRPPYQSRKNPPPDSGWRDVGLSPEEAKASLVKLARVIENAWEQRAARRAKMAELREDSGITLTQARESVLSSNA